MVKLKFKKRIFIIFAMLALILSGASMLTNSISSSEAGFTCKAMGQNMSQSSFGSAIDGASNSDKSNRVWTAEELFRGTLHYTTYFGEGPGTTFIVHEKSERGKHVDGYADVKSKLEASQGCISHKVTNFIPNMILGVTSIITGLTGSIIMSLVGKDFMAETITNVVGGSGNDGGGLIGSFFDSFYMPLVVITVVIMVVTIVYKGLIQFKIREALSSLLWTLGAFIVGVTFMLNPQMLAEFPQKATSTITTCVVGALSGQNCVSGEVEAPDLLTGEECRSSVADGNDSESVVNSLNCTIWKTFTLEPWAEQQFGEPYNELYTKNAPEGGEIWANAPDDIGEDDTTHNDYCVNFESSQSYDDAKKNGKPIMDGAGSEVCNVALYQLYLKTDMQDLSSQSGNNYENNKESDEAGEYDERWYDIIVPMAKDDTKWNNWQGDNQLLQRILTSTMGLIAVLAASTVLFVLALFGGAYKVAGLILMAFAPVFFLFAIEPTRGRRIFLGWLESLVSSILKYFAITVLVVIALVMYAGLLSNTSGMMSLVGIIILTFALHMYRKEIVDLIGASNMGGERLSNKAAEAGEWVGKQAKEKGSAAAGGVIGGAVGTATARFNHRRATSKTIDGLKEQLEKAETEEEREFYEGEIETEEAKKEEMGSIFTGGLAGGAKGGVDSFNRTMKRGNSATANVFQQAGRTKIDMDRQKSKEDESSNKRRSDFASKTAQERLQEEKDELINSENQDKTTEGPRTEGPEGETRTEEEVTTTKGETEEHKEFGYELDRARDSIEKTNYEGDLTEEEIQELDELSEKIKEDMTNEELMEMVRDDAVMNDPNKKRMVSEEIQAKLNAYNTLGMSAGALAGATGLERAGSEDEFRSTLKGHKVDYVQTQNQDSMDSYVEGLRELGTPEEEIKSERAGMLRDTNMNMDNEDFRKSVENAIELEGTNASAIQRATGVSHDEANEMLEVMEDDGIIDKADPEDESKPRATLTDDFEEAKDLNESKRNQNPPDGGGDDDPSGPGGGGGTPPSDDDNDDDNSTGNEGSGPTGPKDPSSPGGNSYSESTPNESKREEPSDSSRRNESQRSTPNESEREESSDSSRRNESNNNSNESQRSTPNENKREEPSHQEERDEDIFNPIKEELNDNNSEEENHMVDDLMDEFEDDDFEESDRELEDSAEELNRHMRDN